MQQNEVICPRCSKKMYYEKASFGGIRGADDASGSLMLGHYKCWNCGEMKEDEQVTQMHYREKKRQTGGVDAELERYNLSGKILRGHHA